MLQQKQRSGGKSKIKFLTLYNRPCINCNLTLSLPFTEWHVYIPDATYCNCAGNGRRCIYVCVCVCIQVKRNCRKVDLCRRDSFFCNWYLLYISTADIYNTRIASTTLYNFGSCAAVVKFHEIISRFYGKRREGVSRASSSFYFVRFVVRNYKRRRFSTFSREI